MREAHTRNVNISEPHSGKSSVRGPHITRKLPQHRPECPAKGSLVQKRLSLNKPPDAPPRRDSEYVGRSILARNCKPSGEKVSIALGGPCKCTVWLGSIAK